ncbi:MAG: ParB/RepB/Spo0J family partition protein [Acidiferrobacterales bacterium]
MSQSKKTRFTAPSSAMHQAGDIINGVETEETVQQVPIKLLELDPQNRPLTKLDLMDPERIDPSDPNYHLKQEFLGRLRELAQSIRAAGGVQQPIRVYKRGALYRVIFGERRVLASVLVGNKTVPAIVETEPPQDLRRMQSIENIQREDVLAWERLQSLRDLLEEEKRQGRQIRNPTDLSQTMGISMGHASMLLNLLEAPKDVAESLRTGKLLSLRGAWEIARIDDAAARQSALMAAIDGAGLKDLASMARRTAVKNEPRRGRKRQSVNLGKTENLNLVKRILNALGKPALRKGVDWNNVDAVQRAWNDFLKEG